MVYCLFEWFLKESRLLIRDSILCFATPLNEKIGLLGLYFIIAMILGCCLKFSIIFSKGYSICCTLFNRSSLHCKPSDGTIFAKKLLNFLDTKLLSDTILVLSSASVILFLTLIFIWKKGLTVCQKRLLSTILVYLGYWKRISFLCKKQIHNCKLFCLHQF